MSCYHPLPAVNYGRDSETGKFRVKLLPHRVDFDLKKLRSLYGKSLMLLPCGKCIGCITSSRNEWAVRILLEASLYKDNCFITLTFDDEHLPSDNVPHREDVVKFMKRLRKAIGFCRVFYCGEKGDKSGRAHYHAIIFGYSFPDKVFHSFTKKGSEIYTSKLLSKLWPYGFSSIGELEPGSACYVASYCNKKKLTGIDDGSFVGMSRHPGLGAGRFDFKWFLSDTIYNALGESSIPRFYHKMLSGLNPFYYDVWKKERLDRCSNRIGSQFQHGLLEEETYLYDENIKLDDYVRRCKSLL